MVYVDAIAGRSFSAAPPKTAIPLYVRMVARTRCITDNFAVYMASWRANSGLELDLWTYEERDAFLRSPAIHAAFPMLDSVLSCVRSETMTADIWRYIVLWYYGGAYADLDLYAVGTFAVGFAEASAFYGWNARERKPTQYFIASVALHPVMYLSAQHAIVRTSQMAEIQEVAAALVTGPLALMCGISTFLWELEWGQCWITKKGGSWRKISAPGVFKPPADRPRLQGYSLTVIGAAATDELLLHGLHGGPVKLRTGSFKRKDYAKMGMAHFKGELKTHREMHNSSNTSCLELMYANADMALREHMDAHRNSTAAEKQPPMTIAKPDQVADADRNPAAATLPLPGIAAQAAAGGADDRAYVWLIQSRRPEYVLTLLGARESLRRAGSTVPIVPLVPLSDDEAEAGTTVARRTVELLRELGFAQAGLLNTTAIERGMLQKGWGPAQVSKWGTYQKLALPCLHTSHPALKRVLFIDSDALPVRSADQLFDRLLPSSHPADAATADDSAADDSAAAAASSNPTAAQLPPALGHMATEGNSPLEFNSGVWLLRPGRAVCGAVLRHVESILSSFAESSELVTDRHGVSKPTCVRNCIGGDQTLLSRMNAAGEAEIKGLENRWNFRTGDLAIKSHVSHPAGVDGKCEYITMAAPNLVGIVHYTWPKPFSYSDARRPSPGVTKSGGSNVTSALPCAEAVRQLYRQWFELAGHALLNGDGWFAALQRYVAAHPAPSREGEWFRAVEARWDKVRDGDSGGRGGTSKTPNVRNTWLLNP